MMFLLFCFVNDAYRLKGAIVDEVPHIFEAVFACTLEVKGCINQQNILWFTILYMAIINMTAGFAMPDDNEKLRGLSRTQVEILLST
jgi:hypothetical protein